MRQQCYTWLPQKIATVVSFSAASDACPHEFKGCVELLKLVSRTIYTTIWSINMIDYGCRQSNLGERDVCRPIRILFLTNRLPKSKTRLNHIMRWFQRSTLRHPCRQRSKEAVHECLCVFKFVHNLISIGLWYYGREAKGSAPFYTVHWYSKRPYPYTWHPHGSFTGTPAKAPVPAAFNPSTNLPAPIIFHHPFMRKQV